MSQLLIVNPQADNWQWACRMVNFLLREGAQVHWATEPFTASTVAGKTLALDRGSFLITDTSALAPALLEAAQRRFDNVNQAIESVQGFVGLNLRPSRIAMYGGGGAPYNHARIFAELGFHVEFITPQEIRAGRLCDYDMLGMPGGGGLAMMGQLNPLGDDGCRRIKDWVQAGGMYIGSCAGSFDAAIVAESFLEVCPQQRQMQMINAMIWNCGDSEWIGLQSPGIGVIESRNLQPDHPVMFGMPDRFPITHYNGPLFDINTNVLADASTATGLSAVADHSENFTPSERFLSCSESHALGETLLGKAATEGRCNIVSGFTGLGRVVLFGSHPEFGYNLAMDSWGLPARMLANAAFWQAGQISETRPPCIKREPSAARSYPTGSGLGRIAQACSAISGVVEQLHGAADDDPRWLAEDHAMAAFGLSGQEIWHRGIGDFADVTERMQTALEKAEYLLKQADMLIAEHTAGDEAPIHLLREMLQAFDEALHYQTPAEWKQDFGYEGILQMLDRTKTMLQRACANLDMDFAASENPYAYFESSPYQLVVGSYLAANGVYLNSWQLLQVHLLRIKEQIFRIHAATKQ